jgi:hypothetical protein
MLVAMLKIIMIDPEKYNARKLCTAACTKDILVPDGIIQN